MATVSVKRSIINEISIFLFFEILISSCMKISYIAKKKFFQTKKMFNYKLTEYYMVTEIQISPHAHVISSIYNPSINCRPTVYFSDHLSSMDIISADIPVSKRGWFTNYSPPSKTRWCCISRACLFLLENIFYIFGWLFTWLVWNTVISENIVADRPHDYVTTDRTEVWVKITEAV